MHNWDPHDCKWHGIRGYGGIAQECVRIAYTIYIVMYLKPKLEFSQLRYHTC